MLCWSCDQEMPDTAEYCPHCEAKAEEEPTEEEFMFVQEAFSNMTPEMMKELREAFEKSTTGEEFVNRIMIGDCLACGGSNTADCENDPEIEDPSIGRCFDCGQLWCPYCDALLENALQAVEHDCPFWSKFDFDSLNFDG